MDNFIQKFVGDGTNVKFLQWENKFIVESSSLITYRVIFEKVKFAESTKYLVSNLDGDLLVIDEGSTRVYNASLTTILDFTTKEKRKIV